MRIAKETEAVDGLIFVGLPLEYNGKLYNVAAGLNHGEILGSGSQDPYSKLQ